MEITKAEIEQIAERRFTREHRRLFLGVLIGAIVLIIGLGLGVHQESIWVTLAIALPIMVGVLIFVEFWFKASNRYTKALIEELEKNPTLTYIPEPKEQTEITKT